MFDRFKNYVTGIEKERSDYQLTKIRTVFLHRDIEPFVQNDIGAEMAKKYGDDENTFYSLSLVYGTICLQQGLF